MKKAKRILALCGVIFLLALYLSTLFLALFDSSYSMGFFKASIYCTIVVPVILYSGILIIRNAENRHDSTLDQKEDSEKED
jgi:hypothetical protein